MRTLPLHSNKLEHTRDPLHETLEAAHKVEQRPAGIAEQIASTTPRRHAFTSRKQNTNTIAKMKARLFYLLQTQSIRARLHITFIIAIIAGYGIVLSATRITNASILHERHSDAIQRGADELQRFQSNNQLNKEKRDRLTSFLSTISSPYHVFWTHPEGDHSFKAIAPQASKWKQYSYPGLLRNAEEIAEQGSPHQAHQHNNSHGEVHSSAFEAGQSHFHAVQTEVMIAGQPWDLYLLQDFTLEHEQQEKLERLILIAALAAIALGIIINELGIRQSLKPLRLLSEEIQQRGSDIQNANPLATVDRASELRELVESFNKLYERLKRSIQRQTQLVAAMSHELLTPISLIQGHTSQVLRRNPELNPKALIALNQVSSQSSRLYRLTHVLLDLSRQGESQSSIHIEPIALIEIASDFSNLIAQQAPGMITLPDEACEASLCLQADRQRLLHVLEEMVDHAILHGGSTQEQPAAFGCEKIDKKMRIRLSLSGYRCRAEDLKAASRSFLRQESGEAVDGGGLSLVLIDTLLQSMGSELRFRDMNSGGIEIFFDLNLSNQATIPSA